MQMRANPSLHGMMGYLYRSSVRPRGAWLGGTAGRGAAGHAVGGIERLHRAVEDGEVDPVSGSGAQPVEVEAQQLEHGLSRRDVVRQLGGRDERRPAGQAGARQFAGQCVEDR